MTETVLIRLIVLPIALLLIVLIIGAIRQDLKAKRPFMLNVEKLFKGNEARQEEEELKEQENLKKTKNKKK